MATTGNRKWEKKLSHLRHEMVDADLMPFPCLSRSSLAGCDLNRRFSEPSQLLHPTVYSTKHLLKATKESRGVFLYLDLHGHSRKKNIFVYGCDPALEGTSIEERVFPRIISRILSNISVSEHAPSPAHFSYDDSHFSIHKSKASTGRVVAFQELGILNAFTVESSFCGAGINLEQKVLRSLARQDVKEENSRQVMPDTSDRSRKITPPTASQEVMSLCHFTRRDLEDAGERLLQAVLHYTNMHKMVSPDKAQQRMWKRNQPPKDNDTGIDIGTSSGGRPLGNPAIAAIVPAEREPFLSLAILDSSAAEDLAPTWERARAECQIRQELAQHRPQGRRGRGEGSGEADEEYDEDSAGSDSDPSGDNLPMSVLRNNRLWQATITRFGAPLGRKSSQKRASRKKKKTKRKESKEKNVKAASQVASDVSESPSPRSLSPKQSIRLGSYSKIPGGDERATPPEALSTRRHLSASTLSLDFHRGTSNRQEDPLRVANDKSPTARPRQLESLDRTQSAGITKTPLLLYFSLPLN